MQYSYKSELLKTSDGIVRNHTCQIIQISGYA